MITFAGAVLFSTKAIIVKTAFNAIHTNALSLLTLRMVFSLPFYLGAAFLAATKKVIFASMAGSGFILCC